jgi:predicted permease
MDHFRQDLRFGARMLLKQRGTAALAIVALALGIGLTTTMFSIVDGVFLRGLPFDHAEALIYVGEKDARKPGNRPNEIPPDDFIDWRRQQTTCEDLAAFRDFNPDVAADAVAPTHYQASRISASTFNLLRVQPAMGRAFAASDEADDAPRVAILSDSAWRVQFAADPSIVGRLVRVDGVPMEVVRVMPPKFGFPHDSELWVPLTIRPGAPPRTGDTVHVFGRLKPGATMAAATAEFSGMAARISQQHPDAPAVVAEAIPFMKRFIASQVTSLLTAMLGAVFGVLLIACVNVTNLLLARAAERSREVGIRLAMGASRRRMIQQLLVEGLMLSAIGATLGLGIAIAGIRFFLAGLGDETPPFWVDVRLDYRVLAFTAFLTVIAALASSLVPAFRVTRQSLDGVLKDTGRGNTGLRTGRFTRILVVAEMTLSFCLLLASGLLAKSVMAVSNIDMPFRTDVLHARLSWPQRTYPDAAAVRVATDRMLESIAAEPGVAGAAVATGLPDNAGTTAIAVEGVPVADNTRQQPRARELAVSPEFFRVMNIAVQQGRLFDARDRDGQPLVAVVTADFAARFFPAADPIGRRLQTDGAKSPWITIVGVVPRLVVANVTSASSPPETIITPMAQGPLRSSILLVSAASGDPLKLLPSVRHAVARLDPDLPLSRVNTVAGVYYQNGWSYRVFGTIFMSFGAAALLMAAAGLYGVIAFGVRSRTQEIGVRMALGAARARILWLVLRQGMVMVGVGMALGIGLGGLLGQQLQLLLFGVTPWDVQVFSTTTMVLVATGLIATLVPARRAASVEPIVALRTE